jgi:amino acid adenylation domain-containing protein
VNAELTSLFQVVRTTAGHVSLWPADRTPPEGWTPAGVTGSREECLQEIDARWAGTPLTRSGAPAGNGTLLELFARTVAAHPASTAVSDDVTSLTYAELDALATRLAGALLGRGLRREDRVVIYRSRGVDLFVAILGVLKAGGTYVAVDTRYPQGRRDAMIHGSDPALVITEPGWADRLQEFAGDVWEWRSGSDPEADEAQLPAVRADDAAAILFTSGSSGQPKAIVLEHGNLVMFGANPTLPRLSPSHRTGQVSSVSFDAFHFETWCSFAHGAEIAVLPSIPELLATDLHRELRRRRITAMLVPTMAVNQVVRLDRDAFAPLEFLLAGGDVLSPAACREILAGAFRGLIVNLYGPAEISTACTAYAVREVPDDADSIPIGRPLDRAAVHLLDADLRPVPAGEIGEIHVSGPGVARGYLGPARLTAERFRPDPFGEPGGRMYATGDRARQLPDGQLDFVGRADNQVKIRGYRVEPGEVERVLCRFPALREAVVETAGSGQDRSLVALVVPHDTVRLRELRAFAAETLPDYMVPSRIIVRSELPVTDHGKYDRELLRRIIDEDRSRDTEYVAPTTETERYLAELWEEVLMTERIGLTDDFFELGGHSLLALVAQRRIKRELRVALDYQKILDTTVLSDLAELVTHHRAARE